VRPARLATLLQPVLSIDVALSARADRHCCKPDLSASCTHLCLLGSKQAAKEVVPPHTASVVAGVCSRGSSLEHVLANGAAAHCRAWGLLVRWSARTEARFSSSLFAAAPSLVRRRAYGYRCNST